MILKNKSTILSTRRRDISEMSINVTDPNFVPEGFHENCREENGRITVTKKNRHLYLDNDHLAKMYMDGKWGCEEGVTYSTDTANCPNGRAPTIDAVHSLSLQEEINFKGRIVCEGGKVFDADTQIAMEKIAMGVDVAKLNEVYKTFQEAMEFEYRHNEIPPASYTISERESNESGIPSGKYKLTERVFSVEEDGITMYTMCDNPECCLMNNFMLVGCATGMVPRDVNDLTMKYFKERKMYKKEDMINGNFDICHRCIRPK